MSSLISFLLLFLEPGRVSDMDVAIVSDNAAQVTWHPPATLNGIVLSYHIYLYKVEDGNRVSIEEWDLDYDDELSVKVFNLCKNFYSSAKLNMN